MKLKLLYFFICGLFVLSTEPNAMSQATSLNHYSGPSQNLNTTIAAAYDDKKKKNIKSNSIAHSDYTYTMIGIALWAVIISMAYWYFSHHSQFIQTENSDAAVKSILATTILYPTNLLIELLAHDYIAHNNLVSSSIELFLYLLLIMLPLHLMTEKVIHYVSIKDLFNKWRNSKRNRNMSTSGNQESIGIDGNNVIDSNSSDINDQNKEQEMSNIERRSKQIVKKLRKPKEGERKKNKHS